MGLPDPDRQADTSQSTRLHGRRQGQKTAVVIDLAVFSDCNIRMSNNEKLENYQDLKGELERACKIKTKVFPVVVRST